MFASDGCSRDRGSVDADALRTYGDYMTDFMKRVGELSMSLSPTEVESSLGAPDKREDVQIPNDSTIGLDFFHKVAGGEKVKQWSYFRGTTAHVLVFSRVHGQWKLTQILPPLPHWPKAR